MLGDSGCSGCKVVESGCKVVDSGCSGCKVMGGCLVISG